MDHRRLHLAHAQCASLPLPVAPPPNGDPGLDDLEAPGPQEPRRENPLQLGLQLFRVYLS